MDTASMIRSFLDRNDISFSRSVEIVYRYHANMLPGCRLNGCEITMRSVGKDVLVRAELPINVMTREMRGVVKYLADLNKRRVDEGKNGYFDLDYLAGKIIFAILVLHPMTPTLLEEVAHYCIGEIEYESDDLLKVVCEECEAALQEADEKRQQEEKEWLRSHGSPFRRFMNWIENIIDPDKPRYRRRRGMPDIDPYDDFDLDDSPIPAWKPHPHSAGKPGFDREEEDEKETETEPMEEEPQPEAAPDDEPEENEAEAPAWEPDTEEAEEESDSMTDNEFLEYIRRRIHEDDDDIIYVPPTEKEEEDVLQEEDEEPQPEEKPEEEEEKPEE